MLYNLMNAKEVYEYECLFSCTGDLSEIFIWKCVFFSRLALVSGLKWVDEVITDAPYAITEQFLNRLFHEYNIDYVIHGDDPCLLPDGTDAYAAAKKAGRYKQIKRTEGVSSTDIVGTEFLWLY